jgi:hypothetical protein
MAFEIVFERNAGGLILCALLLDVEVSAAPLTG